MKMAPLLLGTLRLASHPRQALRHRNIFLLSHMRANTSLLSHIMGSHPWIEGYFETHRSYTGRRDLLKQRLRYYAEHPCKRSSHLFFDKLLHNYCGITPNLINRADSRCIFMLRAPAATIASIMSLYRKENPDDRHASAEGATAYYISRLQELSRLAQDTQRPYFFVDAEALTKQPEAALESLSTWLGLNPSLTPHYATFRHTGRVGLGDSSAAIHSGSIQAQSPLRYADTAIPPDLLQGAQAAYLRTRSVLMDRASAAYTSVGEATTLRPGPEPAP